MSGLVAGSLGGYGLQSQVPETFNFLSDVQARVLIDRNSRASGLTTTQIRTKVKPTRPMKRYVNSRLYQRVLGILREDEIDQDELPSDVLDGLSNYRALLQRPHYLDYSEILRLAADLPLPPPSTGGQATEPVVNLRAHVQDTVRYVVVDESPEIWLKFLRRGFACVRHLRKLAQGVDRPHVRPCPLQPAPGLTQSGLVHNAMKLTNTTFQGRAVRAEGRRLLPTPGLFA
ncbi:hypothetical protein ACWD25_31825 [Streptomyces sp. NPDC002920]